MEFVLVFTLGVCLGCGGGGGSLGIVLGCLGIQSLVRCCLGY